MCGRFAAITPTADLVSQFAVEYQVPEAADYAPIWNIAPTLDIRVVLERVDKQTGEITRQLRLASWGLVPHWAKDRSIGARMINARSETLDSKPSFRGPVKKQRCIIPADGWYEWQKTADGTKQPWYFHSPDAAVLAFAGLYELWADPKKEPGAPDRWLLSTTIITQDAVDELGHIHPRQPILLGAENIDTWLDPSQNEAEAALETLAAPSAIVKAHPVSTRVNRVSNNDASLIEPLEDHPAG
ncbi:MAG TPA: SOS response-associated peptidase [Actinomycetales bacterium]|nr:SOS response-associated peptidase [Actinomycetales bacterium]